MILANVRGFEIDTGRSGATHSYHLGIGSGRTEFHLIRQRHSRLFRVLKHSIDTTVKFQNSLPDTNSILVGDRWPKDESLLIGMTISPMFRLSPQIL